MAGSKLNTLMDMLDVLPGLLHGAGENEEQMQMVRALLERENRKSKILHGDKMLWPQPPADHATVIGLAARPELNGLEVEIMRYSHKKGCYEVMTNPADGVPAGTLSVWLKPSSLVFGCVLHEMHYAIYRCDLEAVRSLVHRCMQDTKITLELQALVPTKSVDGMTGPQITLTTVAAGIGCSDVLQVLLEEAKLNPDARNSDDSTALHLACMKDHPDCVEVLFHANCDTSLKTPHGYVAADMGGGGGGNSAVERLHKLESEKRNRGHMCYICKESGNVTFGASNSELRHVCNRERSAIECADTSYAHLRCLVPAAMANPTIWDCCVTCGYKYTGATALEMAKCRYQVAFRDLKQDDSENDSADDSEDDGKEGSEDTKDSNQDRVVLPPCPSDFEIELERIDAATQHTYATAECFEMMGWHTKLAQAGQEAVRIGEIGLNAARSHNEAAHTLDAMSALARLHQVMKNREAALPLHIEILAQRRMLDTDAGETLDAIADLANTHMCMHNFLRAEP